MARLPLIADPHRRRWISLVWLAVVLGIWCTVVLDPSWLGRFGVMPYGQWFIDSYAVLAAGDAVRQGLDPAVANPLDSLLREHKYSDWWYVLGHWGLTRQDNWAVGLSWVGALLATAWASLRPARWRDALWTVALLLSPPLLLLVNRANNDIVIFALLAVAGLLLARPHWPRIVAAAAAVAVATGLKFYPLVAVAGFLGVRPRRRQLLATGLACLAALAAFLDVAAALPRGQFELPATVHTFGASVLLKDLGWGGAAGLAVSVLLVFATGLGLARSGRTVGLGETSGTDEALVVMGLTVLLACFFAGTSFGYRWVFALWPGAWLWRRAWNPELTPQARRWAFVGSGLILAVLWMDGLLCLAVNLLVPALAPAQRLSLQHYWRLATQPLVWALMALFAGWLIDWLWRQGKAMRPQEAG